MQVHVGEQWGNHCPLRSPYLRFRPLAIFRYPRLHPFLDQAEYSGICHAMLDKLYCPFVRQIVEKASNVRVEHRSEEHTSELQSRQYLVCRLLLEKKKKDISTYIQYKVRQYTYTHKPVTTR